MASPTPKPVSPFVQPTKGATKKAVSPFQKPGQSTSGGAGKPGNPLGAGQAVIDILSMPMYSIAGKITAAQKGNFAGAIFGAGEVNALKWIWGERPDTGADVLKNAGIKDPGFWESLTLDVALDPTTYIGGAAIRIPLKLLTTGTKTVAKAGKLAATGEEIAVRAKTPGAKVSESFTPAYGKAEKGYANWRGNQPVPQITGATARQQRILAKQKAIQTSAQENIARFSLTTTVAPENRTLAIKIGDTLSSMVNAGVKSSASIIAQEIAKRRLKIYAAKSAGVMRNVDKKSRALAKAEATALIAADDAVKAIDNVIESSTSKALESATAPAPVTPKTVAKNFTLEPLVDTAPTLREIAKTASRVSGSEEVKIAAKLLKDLNKFAKSAKVTKISEGQSESVLKRILDPFKDQQTNYIENLPADLLRRAKEATVRLQGTSPFEFFRGLTESSLKPAQILAKSLSDIPILDADGAATTIAALAQKYPLDKNIPNPVMTQIIEKFDMIFNKVGTTENLQNLRIKQLTDELGKEIADKYKELLAGKKKLDINELIALLPAPGTATKGGYKSIEALLRGLKAGDQIEEDSLKKILQALDPESKFEVQVQKAMATDTAYNAYRNLLLLQRPSITEMRKRLDQVTPDVIFKAKNVGAADAAAAYYVARKNNDIPAPDNVMSNTRQARAEALSEVGPARLDDVSSLLGRVIDVDITEVMTDMPYRQISTLGDYVARSLEGKMDATSKAKRLFETNENFGTKITSVAATRWRARSIKKVIKNPEEALKVLRAVAEDIHIADDILIAGLGTRLIVKEQAASVLARKGDMAHSVFLNVADFIDVAFVNGFEKIAQKMIIPFTKNKHDSVSFTGLMDAIRMVLQGAETKNMPELDEIAARIRSTGGNQGKLTPAYKTELKKLSDELAVELVKPETVKLFQEINAGRHLADVEDTMQPGITMLEESWESLVEAWRITKSTDSPAIKAEQVRSLFAEFAYKSHIFDQAYGPAAESVWRAMTMAFIKDGEIAGIKVLRPENQDDWERFRKEVNSYFQQAELRGAAPAGREHLPFPSKSSKDKAQTNYYKAKSEIETHLKDVTKQNTKQDIKKWQTTLNKLVKNLETARNKAWEKWLPIEHWTYDVTDNSVQWIPDINFSPADAAVDAEKNRVILSLDGPVDVGNIMHDVAITAPQPPMTVAQNKAAAAKINEAKKQRFSELQDGAREDAFERTNLLANEIRNMSDSDFDAVIRMEQQRLIDPLLQAEAKTYWYDPAWKKGFAKIDEQQIASPLKNLQKHMSSVAGNAEVQQLSVMFENNIIKYEQRVADVLAQIAKKYGGILTSEELRKGMTLALRRNMKVLPAEKEIVNEFAQQIKTVIDPILKKLGPESTILDEALDMMFTAQRLDASLGFKVPSEIKDKRELFNSFLLLEPPVNIQQNTVKLAKWNQGLSELEKAGRDPMTILRNFVVAVETAEGIQTIGMTFAKEFSHLAQGISVETAIANKWVKIKSVPSTTVSATVGIPEGLYFQPEHAEDFMFMDRNLTGVMNEKITGWLRALLDVTGMVKSLQTVVKPSYHVVNGLSEVFTSMAQGATHASDWIGAIKILKAVGKEDFASRFAATGGDARISRMIRSLEGVNSRDYKNIVENEQQSAIINGKVQNFDIPGIIPLLEDVNALPDSYVLDHVGQMYDEIAHTPIGKTEAETKYKKTVSNIIQDGIRAGSSKWQKALRPVGDLSAYMTNFSRIATVMSIMRRGQFRSVADMKIEISKAIDRYHPSVTSLTAFERLRLRPASTYYTWLRVAHGAMLKLVMDHTAAVLLYPKIQYELSQEQGNEPNSFGKPWDPNQKVPSFLSNSVFGPVAQGPNGQVVIKPSVLPMDVLDNYTGFAYDPAYNFEDNVFKGIGATQSLIGKNINTVLQLPVEFATKTDVRYGTPSTVKDLPTFADRLFSMTAFSGLAQGLGYNPPGKELTPRERELKNISFFVGGKPIDVGKESYQKYTQKEQSARMKAFLEQYSQNK